MAETLDPSIPQPPPQDLHLAELAKPDRLQANFDAPRPTQERLNAPSQHVVACNTSNDQVHIVIDRFMIGHELMPGQSKPMELLKSDIEYFIKQRQPHTVSRIDGGVIKLETVRHPVELRDEHGRPLRFRDQPAIVEPDDVPTPAPVPSASIARRVRPA